MRPGRSVGRWLVTWVSLLGESLGQRATVKGTIALAFTSMFAVTLVTVHVIEPETNLDPVSLYSLGPFGFVMRTGFVFLGLAFFSIVAGLRGRARATNLYSVDLIVLAIVVLWMSLIANQLRSGKLTQLADRETR